MEDTMAILGDTMVSVCVCVHAQDRVYDEIGWIRSHFCSLAEHCSRVSRPSMVGMLQGSFVGSKYNSLPIPYLLYPLIHYITCSAE